MSTTKVGILNSLWYNAGMKKIIAILSTVSVLTISSIVFFTSNASNEAEPVSDSAIIVDMSNNEPTPKQKLSTDPNIQQPVSEPKNDIIWISGSLKDTPNPPCKPAKVVMQTHTDESWNELIKTKPGGLMMTIRSGTGQFFCSYIQESR